MRRMGEESKKGPSPEELPLKNCLLLPVCFVGEAHLLKVAMYSDCHLTQNMQR